MTEIEGGHHFSQRSLARTLGIALGLTNLLIRRLVRKGWVRMVHIKPNRVTYLLTPAGIAEKARMSRDSLQYSVRFYAEARKRVGARFVAVSNEWPAHSRADKRIVFFGTAEVAEIGYVCLQETDLRLVAAIDDQGRSRFFDIPVYQPEWLRENTRDGMPFIRIVIMSFGDVDAIVRRLLDLGVDCDRICRL